MDPMEEDSKFDESMEKKFKEDEFGFRNNETKVERHMLNEAVFDEETVKYSSKNLTKPEESAKASTAQSTTAKKGKYLELMPQGDDNMNTSIPNAAEVWALAGMREIDTRKPMDSDETTEMLTSLNNTAKNLLDWSEITKMGNDSMSQSSDESFRELTVTTVHNEINIDEDPATSENKGFSVFVSSSLPTTLPTLKPIIEDNRVEVETGNVELSENGMNKSHSATARIDNEVFGKTYEDSEDDVELIEPLKTTEKMEKLKVEETVVTTETSESVTTESVETTTMENIETTTSIVDSFTVIGEDEEADEVFKRTITELPPMTTTDLPAAVTTTSDVTTFTPQAITTTSSFVSVAETTTEIFNPTINEIPESTQRYNKAKPTKTIPVWTTEHFDSTENDSESLPATLIPKFLSTRQPIATTVEIRTELSSSSPTIEIFDDDKFKYSTLLPEATTTSAYESKKVEFEEATTEAAKSIESQNRENLDGEKTESGNLGLISGLVSVAVLLVVAGVVYVS